MLKRATPVFVLLMLGSTVPALAAAGFVPSGNMTFGRSSFAAVRLPDGGVLVTSQGSAERYDPASGSFASAGAMTSNRGTGLTATLLPSGLVLIVGGQAGDASLASAEIYDPVAGTFTPTGSMSTPRSFHTATLLDDGRVLITGGHRFNHWVSALASAEVYDAASGTFTLQGSMSVVRQDHTATLLRDGRVLIAGGLDNFSAAKAGAELYDPATGGFTATGSMAAGRGNHTATRLANGTVLVTGGYACVPCGSLSSAEIYIPGLGSFSPIADMTAARGDHTAAPLTDGTVLVAGGFTSFPFAPTLASAEIYDPAAASFTATASMHGERGRHVAVALRGGDVLVAGGMAQFGRIEETAEVFSLVVIDRLPPVVTVPGDITVPAAGPDGAVVEFTALATDDVDVDVAVTCVPGSGSLFPVGTTTVTCTATDTAGNTGIANFPVTVLESLDIAITIDPVGLLHATTGLVTLRGTFACNRQTQRGIGIDLSQDIGGEVRRGSGGRAFSCVPPSLDWIASVSADGGQFRPGTAQATVSGEFCDPFGCDSEVVTATVQLQPRLPASGPVILTKVAETRTVTPEGIGPFAGLSAPFVRKGIAVFQGYGPEQSHGFYAGSGRALTVMADTNTAIPGGSGNFARLDSPTFDGSTLAFQGFDAFNNAGLYTWRGGELRRIADRQTPVPGGMDTFGGFIGPVLGGGKVAFRGSSDPAPFLSFGIYAADADGLTVIADRQTPLPGGTGNFGFFGEPAIHRDTVVFEGIGFNPGERGIYSSTEGSLTTVADLNTSIPGGTAPFLFFGAPAVRDGLVAFPGFDASFRAGIYKNADGTLANVADSMTPIPFQSSTFGAFGPPVIDDGVVAFVGLDESFNFGGIYASEGDTLTPIADVDTPAPGGQGNLVGFETPALARGNVAFQGLDATGTQGIYARAGGRLRKIFSATDTLDGKAVSFIEFATTRPCDFNGCRGSGTGFDGRHVGFLATFSDGSQSIYLASEREAAATLWVGLKNRDDQGTQFDLRADLYVNGERVARGLTRCVTGINRGAAKAKEVLVPFGPISNEEIASGDVLALKVFTRIGTNEDGTECPGRGNAVGLRLYYDGADRPSGFGAEISPDTWTDYFLRSRGAEFFLDAAPPVSTQAKQKDSGPVKFGGGNPWREIGTWSRAVP
jgi:hypothetical protein